eukprot:gb/GEZN01002525.1/.p1 GENE.gb/GEZN01002525.1/~~gb/GEZN01002525.1/.p1  ORF type:complete len:681 (-),score=119.68 gb/GEZN01002525.1/:357-2399(-)
MGCWKGLCNFTKPEVQAARIGEKRSCTDLVWLALFVAGWAVFIWVVLEARRNGADPNKIIRAVDINGRICGISEGVENKPYGAWPYPLLYDPKICVSSCSETLDASNTQMAWLHRSELFVYYCVPNFVPEGNVSVSIEVQGDFYKQFETLANQATRSVGDLYIIWPYILLSGAVALVVTFFFTFLLRFLASCVIWCSILLLAGGGFLLGFSLLDLAKTQDGSDFGIERKKVLTYSGYAAYVLVALFLLLVFFLRIQIKVAVELVKEASRAISDMKSVVLFPVFPFVFCVGYFALLTVGALLIFSVSELVPSPTPTQVTTYGNGFQGSSLYGTHNANPDTMQSFQMQEDYRVYLVALVFHMLWNVQFLAYFCFFVVSGSVSNWYFTYRDHMGNKIRGNSWNELPGSPVYKSAKRTIRYHLGTVAVAALIIAIIKTLRILVKYIEDKATPRRGRPSGPQKCVLKALGCCLRCVECCMDKVSKNGLIWTAIWGDPFLTACCSSFALIWRHLRKVAALQAVSVALMFIGKVTVAVVTTGVCVYALVMDTPVEQYGLPSAPAISSPIAPAILVFILAYTVASLFMNIFETAIQTTLLCFLVDCEHGKDGELFASRGLTRLIERHGKLSAEIAAEEYAHAKRGIRQGGGQDAVLIERPEAGEVEGGRSQPQGSRGQRPASRGEADA